MALMRINKTKNYTVMSNYHLREKNMSLKAKGLLSQMLSLPDDWDYSVAGLCCICKESQTAITNTLKELKKFGYLTITKLMPSKEENRSKIEYIYDIFEEPQEGKKQGLENPLVDDENAENKPFAVFEKSSQEGKKQGLENLGLENLGLENQRQINTNKQNTKKQSTYNNTRTQKNEKKAPPTQKQQYISYKEKERIEQEKKADNFKKHTGAPINFEGDLNDWYSKTMDTFA